MQEQKTSANAPALSQRALFEATGFIAALAITIASAIAAKEAGVTPALAVVDGAPEAQRADLPKAQTVAAAPEAAPPSRRADVELTELSENEAEELGVDDLSVRWFGGRQVRPVRTVWMTVTAYSPDHRSCGKWADGITASNRSVWTNGMKLVAADTRILPFGSLLSVPGYDDDRVVPVLDRGGAIKGDRLDVLYPTHAIAREWGVQRLPVTIWEYVD